MNLNKHAEFFDPRELSSPIHIIGVGAIGSTVAEMLTRLGCPELNIYDIDTVSEHNLTNQMFRFNDIGAEKVDAVEEILKSINPDIVINKHPEGYTDRTKLNGYVFLCVDSIELRRKIVNDHMYNLSIEYVADFRMRLTDAQTYAADWSDDTQRKKLAATMQFSSDEAKEATPVSACGTTLNVTPTVRTIVSLGIANFINLTKGKEIKTMMLVDSFSFNIICFPE